MDVLLIWSGERSKETAEALSTFLKQVIQAVDPWMSPDISKGERWTDTLLNTLEKSKLGIVCLTSENLESKWILFESGSLSKTIDAKVCTFLLDLTSTDIELPLSFFQDTKFEKNDVRKLVDGINSLVKEQNERFLDEAQLSKTFELFWSELKGKLDVIVRKKQPRKVKQDRSDRDILEEILAILRTLERGRQLEKHREVLSETVKRLEEEYALPTIQMPQEEVEIEIPKIIKKSREKRRPESDDSEVYFG